jgi:hypothetical protein
MINIQIYGDFFDVLHYLSMQDFILEEPVPDMSGQALREVVTNWITVQQASLLFTEAGLPRNKRSIRRYCERGDLECKKTENALHQPQYFIDATSVVAYIEQQRTLMSSSADASGAVLTEPDSAGHGHGLDDCGQDVADTQNLSGDDRTLPDESGQSRTINNDILADQLVQRLHDKDEEIAFLRGELLHRRTTDSALHDVIAAFRANAETQRIAASQNSSDGQGTSTRSQ